MIVSILQKLLPCISYVKERGFFDLLSAQFLTQFLGFATGLIVAKILTPLELGEVRIIESYAAFFLIIAGFGFNSALLKLNSESRPPEERAGILRLTVSKSLGSAAVTLVLIFILSSTGILSSSERISNWIVLFSLSIPFTVLAGLFVVHLQAQKKIRGMARAQSIIKVQSILLVAVGTWIFGVRGFIWGTIISSVFSVIPLLRQVGFGFIKTSLDKAPANFMRYSLFSALANGVSILGQRGDIFILDYFIMDREAIGYYSLGLIFASAGLQVTGTVQAITTSYFSERAGESSWFRKQLVRNQTNMALLSVGVAIALFAAASLLVPLVYGPEYLPALSYLAILLLGYVIRSSHSLIGVGLFSLGLMHYNFVIGMITTAFSLGLSYVLLLRLGTVGVAWGQVGASALSLVIMVVVISRVLSNRAQMHE